MALVKSEIRINQFDPNVTLAAGVADQESEIMTFTCPDRTALHIRPSDIFSLYLADTTPIQLASTCRVKLIHADPNDQVQIAIVDVAYTVLTEWQDKDKMYTFGVSRVIKPKDRLRLKVTGNLAVDSAQTKFQFSALRVAEVVSV
jgi:hypothetical protein